MKIGYSYWGYLGDTKYDSQGNIASTPDGNAIYSWSIIYKLLKDGHQVYQIMPDRDYVGINKLGSKLFNWCRTEREYAWRNMTKLYNLDMDWSKMNKTTLFHHWDNNNINECDAILHEWRMLIPGRNDSHDAQPDYFIQECLIEYCAKHSIKLIIFDLDYHLSPGRYQELLDLNRDTYLLELGYKWSATPHAKHVEIPFDFSHINEFPLAHVKKDASKNLIYVGNRYERDWCIDKYIPTDLSDVIVYGNWLESGRDSKEKWPNITFGPRIQTADMPTIYQDAICTILLAKKDYLEYRFMTARIIEAVFYGCVPLFISEYGRQCIKKYAGIFADDLTVDSKEDVINAAQCFKENMHFRRNVISYLRGRLAKIMDIKYFTNEVYGIIKEED